MVSPANPARKAGCWSDMISKMFGREGMIKGRGDYFGRKSASAIIGTPNKLRNRRGWPFKFARQNMTGF